MPITVGLLQMVADDLVSLAGSSSRASRPHARGAPPAAASAARRTRPRPRARGRSETRPRRPPPRSPAGSAACGRASASRRYGVSLALGKQFDDCRSVEAASLHRGALEQQTLARFEGVDAGRQHRTNARRQRRAGRGPLSLHGDELLEEQWIPVRTLDDSREHRLWSSRPRAVRRARWPRPSAAVRGRGAGAWADLPTPVGVRAAPGRAEQRSRTGKPLEDSATYSSRSSKVGSAQCRSSNTAISGRSRATASKKRRTAHDVSSGGAAPSAGPIAPSTRLATRSARSSSWRSSRSVERGSPSARPRTMSANGR